MIPSDHDLLRAYAHEGSETSFAELVRRHLDLVYSAARRQVDSPDLAQEVAQSVFLDLARGAHRINPGTPLVAWLHLVSRRTAIDVVRRESRRQARERAAVELADMKPSPSQWIAIEPLLDEAVESLPEPDRAAILLRYFENKSLREVGSALGSSEDAAQKRVTRAIEHLRTFFARRGIAVTSAGFVSDLSAHALRTAPTGLGSTIATATANIVPAVAITSTVATIAMTTIQKAAVAAALVAAAVVIYEAVVIRRQGRVLEDVRAQTNALTTETAGLRAARKTIADRLMLARSQIDARRTQVAATAASTGDAALEAQMSRWLTQRDQLKRFVSDRRALDIPELQFLTEQDWFGTAASGQLATEEDFRKASSRLRHTAEGMFAGKLHYALTAYVKANPDRLPENPQKLLPFFAPPIDPTLLDRYEMIHRGRVADIPPADRTRVIAPKTPADVEHDAYYSAGLGGYGNTPAHSYNLMVAEREFRKINPGQDPATAVQLLPHLKWPVDAAVLQSYLDRRADWQRKGGSR